MSLVEKNECEDKLECGFCSNLFIKESKLVLHIKMIHFGITNYKWDQCQKSFTVKRSLKRHIRNVHDIEGKLACKICDMCFENNDLYSEHIKIHETIPCDLCGKLISKRGFKEHKNSIHDRIRNHKCELCEKDFYNIFHLKGHLKNVHDVVKEDEKSEDFKCLSCKKIFKYKSSLNLHIKTLHMKIKNYKCEVCDETFSQKHHLNGHQIAIHNKGQEFKYDLCQKVYSRKYHLKEHKNNVHFDLNG